MAARTVSVKLNQQQLELIDRTVAKGEASDRAELIRRALREQAAKKERAR
jgi:Arc/MetJ-type ribon-helix-helix transcriptional regulator